MKAEDKAKKLVDSYIKLVPEHFDGMDRDLAKQCALICVDEIEKASHKLISKDLSDLQYWQEVKTQIEKL